MYICVWRMMQPEYFVASLQLLYGMGMGYWEYTEN